MLDYLVHPRFGLLVAPFVGAFVAAAWEAKREGMTPTAVAKTSLTAWMPLLVTSVINLILITAWGAQDLASDGTEFASTIDDIEAPSSTLACLQEPLTELGLGYGCLEPAGSALAASADSAADFWLAGVAIAVAIGLAAWLADGAATKGEQLETTGPGLSATAWALILPSGLAYLATVGVYLYGRGLLG